MTRSRFADSQILAVLKHANAGTGVPDRCRVRNEPLVFRSGVMFA
jgi:hypothetical protein